MRQKTPDNRAEFTCRRVLFGRFLATVIACLTLILSVACSPGEKDVQTGVAQYGESGAEFARRLAAECPRRLPYSDQESRAADLIMEELKRYGYAPEKQLFSVTDEEGVRRTSANIIAKQQGNGFALSPKLEESVKATLPDQRHGLMMILGAHYDTPAVEQVPDEDDELETLQANGIHDNASGVASVLTAARVMREMPPGYDVTFVFFGAGTDSFEGARHYLSTLSVDVRKQVEVMVNIGPVFAGDKVYAHAGQNSVRSDDQKDYAKRRKLYQVTDIFFENQLNSRNRYAIYTNQASFLVPGPHGGSAIFREWTTKTSDHTPFDDAGIPIVFMESGDYRVRTEGEVGIESRNPFFHATGGIISGTPFDQTDVLEDLFRKMDEQAARQTIPVIDPTGTQAEEEEPPEEEEYEKDMTPIARLPQRINNTAFVIVQLARKGPLNYDYNG
ncbi:MAG TPA: M28 family peptidase [Clostridia bacterium]|nr:M28 family peptidase [Clostridia bacterium]